VEKTLSNRVVGIIQARVGSTRLPKKIFAEISGKPLLYHVLKRARKSRKIHDVVVATTRNPQDDVVEDWCLAENVSIFRGDEEDVLRRFYEAAVSYNADTVVRITADDPFKDPVIIDQVIDMYFRDGLDFSCNNNPPSFPEGLDVEVFSMDALTEANINASSSFEREHVTQYFYRHPKKYLLGNYAYKENISQLRWTIDTEEDLKMVRAVYNGLYSSKKIFLMEDILEFLLKNRKISIINSHVKRSDMYTDVHARSKEIL
jgi:spore coat polysaccharide biosynthesis protein SpsF